MRSGTDSCDTSGDHSADVDETLAAFLAPHEPPQVGEVMWGGNTQLEVSSWVHPDPPPLALVTSIRALVVADEGVAVLHNANGSHILPGGRREPGESVGETLRREILEETGFLFLDAALDALGP